MWIISLVPGPAPIVGLEPVVGIEPVGVEPSRRALKKVVGAQRFELWTSWSRTGWAILNRSSDRADVRVASEYTSLTGQRDAAQRFRWPFDPKATGLPVTHRDIGAYIMWAA